MHTWRQVLIPSRKQIRSIAIGCICLPCIWFLVPPSFSTPQSLRVLDRHGTLLYEVRPNDRGAQERLRYEEIPQDVIGILLATEDRTFFSHIGVSARGTMRALVQNVQSGRVVSGGSTITQQLVRQYLQPEKRTLLYKMKEALYALKIDLHWSKETILTEYLNTAYFGNQRYGLAAAADGYLGKSVAELSRAEISLLVGLLQSPSVLNPFQNFSGAKERQRVVIQNLVNAKFISIEEAEELQAEPIYLQSGRTSIHAPHFVFWVLNAYQTDTQSKTELRTTLDLPLQTQVEHIVDYQLDKLIEQNVTSAAVVVLDTTTGEVLSMVGSADYFDTENDGAVNVALSARQPGSALKPFTYALALADGHTAATTVADTDVQFRTQEGTPYTPRNYDYQHHGLVRYREALANSYNIPAVKVLQSVGVHRLLNLLKSAGIATLTRDPEHYGLALTLGSGEVRLLELAAAYGAFARGGQTLYACPVMHGCSTPSSESILDERVAWLVSHILSDSAARIPQFGEGNLLEFEFPVAAKTGTTRNNRDNWLIGYTPQRIVGVWVGNADNSPMRGTSGITGAGPIFHDVMNATMQGLKPQSFTRPAGIVEHTICRVSGKIATELCPQTMREVFIKGTEPREEDDIFTEVLLDTRNGLLAGDGCDSHHTQTEVFAVFPPDVRSWARENGWKQPPTEYSPLCGDASSVQSDNEASLLSITTPHHLDRFLLDPTVPDELEMIILKARSSAPSVHWYINDQFIGTGSQPDYRIKWKPELGVHTVRVESGDLEDVIRIEVVE